MFLGKYMYVCIYEWVHAYISVAFKDIYIYVNKHAQMCVMCVCMMHACMYVYVYMWKFQRSGNTEILEVLNSKIIYVYMNI